MLVLLVLDLLRGDVAEEQDDDARPNLGGGGVRFVQAFVRRETPKQEAS